MGEVQIPIEEISPEYKETIIKVELDAKSHGITLESPELQELPNCLIKICRQKTMAYSASYLLNSNNITEKAESIIELIRPIIIKNGYETVNFKQKDTNQNNFDYYIKLNIESVSEQKSLS